MNAAIARSSDINPGSIHDVLGMTHRYQTSAAHSGAAFTSFETEIPPGCGSPMHRHERDTEFFFVLTGELTFVDDEGQRVCKAGQSAYLPAGRPHAFYNATHEAARAFVVVSPGAEAEQFFAAIDAAQRQQSMDVTVVSAIAQRYGITILASA
ncbi:MAG: cupin domain-containing protein [Steroidobacteraceae bacterium]